MQTPGLTSAEAADLLARIGPNALESRKPGLAAKLAKQCLSPTSLMLLGAAGLSVAAGHRFDAGFILVLLAVNVGISLLQEGKADRALEVLKARLSTRARAFRDGSWTEIASVALVPGDYVEVGIGGIVPADLRVIEARNASLNEASVTGESLPKEKRAGDTAYSGTYLLTGVLRGTVTATGPRTGFGRTFLLAEAQPKRSLLERDILTISGFLTKLSLAAVVVLTAVLLLAGAPALEVVTLDLSLVIAGIPISLPTVLTMIISFGVVALSKKRVIVRRLSSLQDLANVDLLFTDKTGTLTKNTIEVTAVHAYGGFPKDEVLRYAAAAAAQYPDDVINAAILAAGADPVACSVLEFTPADSTRKHSTLVAERAGKRFLVSLGAAQVVLAYCELDDDLADRVEGDVAAAAKGGFRALALAIGDAGERHMRLAGLLLLSDTLRADSRSTLASMRRNGIGVRMLTGDNRAIAARVAADVGLEGEVLARPRRMAESAWEKRIAASWEGAAAFAEILPADKLAVVRAAAIGHTVAVTGDGINDLPAVKSAQVGIAVQNAVEALKESADLVLLGSGIGVIKDAVIESRKIFARVYTYSVYRLSESFRLIITIAILGMLLGTYPLTPIQLILLALLNDIPIILLAWDRVKVAAKPASINVRQRFLLSTLFGAVGVANSLLLYFGARYWLHLGSGTIETLYFLKLTVGGHLLIYVAHTSERWWKYLPSPSIILGTTLTQLIASTLALTGLFMPAALPWQLVAFVWLWAFFWMQVSEAAKWLQQRMASEK